MILNEENLQYGLAVVGALFVFVKVFRFCKGALRLFRNYGFKTYTDFKKYGKWAVVTGGTSGIGKNIALELARRGIPIIIISQNPRLLKEASAEIERKCQVPTKTLAIDFRNTDRKIYDEIEEFLRGLDIGILVNNVGMAPPIQRFVEIPVAELKDACHDIVNVNVLPAFRMTQLVLPGMKERRRGLIMNISSMSAIVPLPDMALYGSTKALLNYFSQALALETKEFGVEVQSVMPGFVRTKMVLNKKWNMYTMEPDFYARSTLATVGKDVATHGCFLHELQALQFSLASEKILLKKMDTASKNVLKEMERQKQKQN